VAAKGPVAASKDSASSSSGVPSVLLLGTAPVWIGKVVSERSFAEWAVSWSRVVSVDPLPEVGAALEAVGGGRVTET